METASPSSGRESGRRRDLLLTRAERGSLLLVLALFLLGLAARLLLAWRAG